MMEITQFLPWLNVLLLPGVAYVIRLERRIITMEVQIQLMLSRALGGCAKVGE